MTQPQTDKIERNSKIDLDDHRLKLNATLQFILTASQKAFQNYSLNIVQCVNCG